MLTAIRKSTASGDRTKDNGSTVVQWVVETPSITAAYAAEGIAEYGSPHPDDDRLFLDRFAHDTDGVTTEITGYYSRDGRFRGSSTRLEKQEGWFKFAPVRGKETSVDIPINTRVKVEISGTGPNGEDQSSEIEVWEVETWKSPLVMTAHRLDVYARVPQREALDAHVEMIGHVHTVRGRPLKFLGMTDAREEGDNFWTLTYEWIGDPGTLWPTPRTTPRSVILSPSNRATDEVYLRLPFETIVPGRSDDPENIPIDVLGIIGAPTFASEWRTLPGIPPL